MTGYKQAVIFLLAFIAGLLLASCSTPTKPDAASSPTRELCEYRADCLGIERDYAACDAVVLECGATAVLACLDASPAVTGAAWTDATCIGAAQCLETACGRGVGLGVDA